MVAIDQSRLQYGGVSFQIVSSVVASLCVTVIVALFLSKMVECCKNLFSSKSRNVKPDVNENNFLRKPQLKYEPLQRRSERFSGNFSNMNKKTSMSMESLDSYKTATFEIPGMMVSHNIQPFESSTSGYSTTSCAESLDGSTDGNRVFLDEYIQPDTELLPRSSALGRKSWNQENTDGQSAFKLELYESKFRKSQTTGSLGKLKFSLQYEDKTKRKLMMNLHELSDLQYVKGTEQVTNVFITAMLIPERDYTFTSKKLDRGTKIRLNELFSFHSRPHNRDFEARTIHLNIVYIEGSGKEIVYGESRMPLLSHEIYSQVPTDICIGIKPTPNTGEIGDAQIVLSYSSHQKKLNVMVKTIRISQTNLLENLTGLHIKAHLVRVGGEKLGKKRSVSKSLPNPSANLIDFQDHMSFSLDNEIFLSSTLKIHIHGKHKIMGKHISLGKLKIGDSNRDEGGKVHWRTVNNSEGIGWTMWHPIATS